MSKDKLLDNNVDKALSWCKEARDILKIRHKGVFRSDEKMAEFSKLDKCLENVRLGLKALEEKGNEKHAAFAREFIARAELGRVAKESDNKELSKLLIDHLVCLDLQIQVALGKELNPKVNVDDLKKSLGESDKRQFELALSEAERIESSLVELTLDKHIFSGKIPNFIKLAKNEFKSGKLPAALTLLGNVPTEEIAQRESYERFLKYRRRLARAREHEDSLKIVDQVKKSELAKTVTTAITAAEKQSNERHDYEQAIKELKNIDNAFEKGLKSLNKEQRKFYDEFRVAREDFEEAFEKKRNLINQARSLRGMLEGDPKDLLDEAEMSLATARHTADLAVSIEALKRAKDLLEPIEQQVKNAIEASDKAKKQSNANLKAQEEWLKLLPQARRQLELVRTLRGTEKEQSEIELLIAKAIGMLRPEKDKTVETSELVTGYPEAVNVLKEYLEVVERAKQTNEQAETHGFPKLIELALSRISSAIGLLDDIAPRFFVDVQFEERAELEDNIRTKLFKAKDDPKKLEPLVDDSLEQCRRFDEFLNQERVRQLDEKKLLNEKFVAYEQKKVLLKELPEGMFASADRLVKIAQETDVVDREWRRGIRNVDTALLLLDDAGESFQASGKDWLECEKLLPQFKQLAGELLNWPALTVKANQLRQDCEDLEALFKKTLDFELCVREFKELVLQKQYAELARLKQEQNVPDKEGIELLAKAVREATKRIRERAKVLEHKLLPKLEQHYLMLEEPRNNGIRVEFENYVASWEDYRFNPDSTPSKVESQAKVIIEGFERLEKRVQELLDDPQGQLTEEIEQLKNQENLRHASDMPRFILGQIERIEHPKVAKRFRDALEQLEHLSLAGDDLEALQKLREDVLKVVALQQKQRQGDIDEANKVADDMAEKLLEIKARHKNFQPYQERLESEVRDAKAMIESGDPELLAMARKSLVDIERRVREVHPKLRDKNGPRYGAAEDRHTKIGKMLGMTDTRGGAIVIENRMPNTYLRLTKKFDETWVKASKLSPTEAFDALDEIEREVTQALEQAFQLNAEHEKYKERKSKFDGAWKKLKEKTGTSWWDKTKNVEHYVESRLSEANAMRHTENGLPGAFRILADLESEVRTLLEHPDQKDMREALQQWDSRCFQEQEQIRDMARQFRVELENFKEVTLSEAKQRIESNYERKLIHKQDRDDLLKIVEALKNQGSAAGKMVKPYLANLESAPIKRIGADEAPRIDKARADFKNARDLLHKGRLSAERLANATTTTNVNITEDLGKVQQHWITQAKQYTATMRKFAQALVTESGKITAEKSGLQDEDVKKIQRDASEASKLVEQMAGHFSLTAFQKPFGTLTDDEAGGDKKRAARELALRTMREYRDDVLNHPVLRKVTDESNPVLRQQLLAATGYVRAALKRIEIESLIGV